MALNPKHIPTFYDRRTRIAFELAIAGFIMVDLALLVPYVVELWIEPGNDYLAHHPSREQLSRIHSRQRAMAAMYLVPPTVTLIVNLLSATLYAKKVMPVLYALCFVPVMMAGWILSLTLWMRCLDIDGPAFCYQKRIVHFEYPSGVTPHIEYGWAIVTSAMLAIYTAYLYRATLDYNRYRKRGLPPLPKDVLELEGDEYKEVNAPEQRLHSREQYGRARAAYEPRFMGAGPGGAYRTRY